MWQDLEIRREVEAGAAAHVIGGGLDPGELLSPPQRTWARRGGHDLVDEARLEELAVHGPLAVYRVKVTAQVGLRRADLSISGSRAGGNWWSSTHCGPHEVTATATAFEALIDEREIAVARWYRTKTALWKDEFGA